MTITGTGLSGTTRVNFGTKAVTPTSVSPTSVGLTIPSGCAGQANVSVTAGGVNSNSLAFFFNAAPQCSSLTPNVGPGTPSSPIDIFGSGLATATSATFGTLGSVGLTAANIVSDVQLTGVIPPAHGTFTDCTDSVDVVLTSPSGGTSTPSGPSCQFTYYDTPTVSTLTPSSGPAGTTGVIVDGTCFVDVSSVDFVGATTVPAPSFSVNGLNQLVVDVPAVIATGAYSIVVTTPGGPSTPTTPGADVFTVTP